MTSVQTRDTILIVDDIEMNRDILESIFAPYFNTHCCQNGLDAYEYLKENEERIVTILLDLIMPVMTGHEFLQKAQDNGLLVDKVPIFIITAEENESIQLSSFEYGITDVIEKPFNATFLLKRVSSQIDLYLTKKSLEYTNMQQSLTIAKQAEEFAELSTKVISTLALAIEFRSGETSKHIQSIQTITYNTLKILKKLNFKDCENITDEQIDQIAYASVLHDIGKIAIPDSILSKPGKLTPEEYDIIKTHTVHGSNLIEKIGVSAQNNPTLVYAYDICRHHHERYDGRGYPDGLKGEDIPIWTQIVSLADVYDALTQKRSYKQAFTREKALNMIQNNECGVFNPDLVKVFVENIDEICQKENCGLELTKS